MPGPRLIRYGCVVAGDSPASPEAVRLGKVNRNSTAILASLFFMGLLLVPAMWLKARQVLPLVQKNPPA